MAEQCEWRIDLRTISDARKLRPDDVLLNVISGSLVMLTERKETDDGWWLGAHGGLGDRVAQRGWLLLAAVSEEVPRG